MQASDATVLGNLIHPTRIKLALAGTSRDLVLEELVDVIPGMREAAAAREKLLKALREREQLHSTGIGEGVALPHARNALIGLVDKPVIVFGRHATGVPYGAVDGKPARLFFLIVAPSVTQHLAVLARISRVLRDPGLHRRLLVAAAPSDVVEAINEAEAKMYRK